MKTLYIAIDVGCHECGVNSEVIGAYWTSEAAEKVAKELGEKSKCWRDGGQSIPEVFAVPVPEDSPLDAVDVGGTP